MKMSNKQLFCINSHGYIIFAGSKWDDKTREEVQEDLEIESIAMDVYSAGDKKGQIFYQIAFKEETLSKVYDAEMFDGIRFAPSGREEVVINKIKTPDGTILISRSVHGFIQHQDKQMNEFFAAYGGFDYLQRIGPKRTKGGDGWEELSVSTHDPFVKIRENLEWGVNTTKDGDVLPKTIWTKLCDLSNDHIATIIEKVFSPYEKTEANNPLSRTSKMYLKMMRLELVWREHYGIEIPDSPHS